MARDEQPVYEETRWPAETVAGLVVVVLATALVLPPAMCRYQGGPSQRAVALLAGAAGVLILACALVARPLRIRVTAGELLLSGGLPPAPTRLALVEVEAAWVTRGFRVPFGCAYLGRARWGWWRNSWAYAASFSGSLRDCFRALDGVEIVMRGGMSLFVESCSPAALALALSGGSSPPQRPADGRRQQRASASGPPACW